MLWVTKWKSASLLEFDRSLCYASFGKNLLGKDLACARLMPHYNLPMSFYNSSQMKDLLCQGLYGYWLCSLFAYCNKQHRLGEILCFAQVALVSPGKTPLARTLVIQWWAPLAREPFWGASLVLNIHWTGCRRPHPSLWPPKCQWIEFRDSMYLNGKKIFFMNF